MVAAGAGLRKEQDKVGEDEKSCACQAADQVVVAAEQDIHREVAVVQHFRSFSESAHFSC